MLPVQVNIYIVTLRKLHDHQFFKALFEFCCYHQDMHQWRFDPGSRQRLHRSPSYSLGPHSFLVTESAINLIIITVLKSLV